MTLAPQPQRASWYLQTVSMIRRIILKVVLTASADHPHGHMPDRIAFQQV